MKRRPNSSATAKAVHAIVEDLRDRRGLGREWDQIEFDIRKEIEVKWAGLIKLAMATSDIEKPQTGCTGILKGRKLVHEAPTCCPIHDEAAIRGHETPDPLCTGHFVHDEFTLCAAHDHKVKP